AVPVVRPPALHLAAHVVDQSVGLSTLARYVEVELLLDELPTALPAGRNRDERLARSASLEQYPGRTVWPDLEVPLRRLVWRVDDRVAEVNRSFLAAGACHPTCPLPFSNTPRRGMIWRG